ncbi:MucR family transcriptional regulator [Rhizobium mesoamericanum]|uniref:MucR family transcriptional regulator n=1 Tax=Rhizobium mesoamericanum TaxID=1079800 RepID=UPI0003F56B06|nr:MucR family transcriptional regulator [Rhizobium mesoamericanum]
MQDHAHNSAPESLKSSDVKGEGEHLVHATARIVEAYVSFNHVPANELPAVISGVGETVRRLAGPKQVTEAALTPAVAISDSITADYIICLENGRKFRSLKKHLGTLGLTPEQYRAKWNLPEDYPMVAPNYSSARSRLAKESGLGRRKEKRSRVA